MSPSLARRRSRSTGGGGVASVGTPGLLAGESEPVAASLTVPVCQTLRWASTGHFTVTRATRSSARDRTPMLTVATTEEAPSFDSVGK